MATTGGRRRRGSVKVFLRETVTPVPRRGRKQQGGFIIPALVGLASAVIPKIIDKIAGGRRRRRVRRPRLARIR